MSYAKIQPTARIIKNFNEISASAKLNLAKYFRLAEYRVEKSST